MKVYRTGHPNLVKNGAGTYYAKCKVRQKTIWRSLKTKIKSQATTLLGDKLREMRGAPEPKPADLKGAATFEEVMEVFKAKVNSVRRTAPRTKETKLRSEFTLRRTWPALFSMELRRITASQLQAWLERYVSKDSVYTPPNAKKTRPGNSASTVNKAVQFLRDVFATGMAQGVCLSNPALELEKDTPRRKELIIPTGTQFKAMVAHIRKGAGWGRRSGDLIEGLAYTGMRIGELRRVRWRHINLEGKVKMLSVPGTKSDTSLRPMPMSAKFEALVRQIRARTPKAGPEDRVFKAKEAPVSLANACKAVGVPHMTHHDLRHFFTTKALQNGIAVHILAGWLGHADGGALLLRTYAHYMPEHAAAMAEQMNFD
jgi:integrase